MTSHATDEHALAAVDWARLADDAVKTVGALWRDGADTFARSTLDDPTRLRPTVTFRCTETLLAAQHGAPDLVRDVREVITSAAKAVADVPADKAQQQSDLKYELYTLALHTLAIARVELSQSDAGTEGVSKLDSMVQRLTTAVAGASEAPPPMHPFVEEHVLRALIAARPHLADPSALDTCVTKLIQSVRDSTKDLLAKHHMTLLSPAESVVLAFCAAALIATGRARDDKIALSALHAAAEAQDTSGSWPLGRVVREDPDGRLEISTYEVAWVTAQTLETLLSRDACSIHDPETALIAGAVARAGRFAERSVIEIDDGVHGWASDHPYQEPRVESWTSAIVLQFALASIELRDDLRNRRVLASFSASAPSDPSWPSWLRWEDLAETAEPDAGHPVYRYLAERVIAPIERDPRKLPSGKRECASVLLFGPPGTAKTTIVKAVAQRLDWPVVSLSPGSFIEKGLEAIEASARSVFDRLQQLRRVVVIFDECDELFRKRDPSGNPDQTRGISAFVTASMLPKLQDLHDRGQVLFFICTNHVEMMDEAVVRGGRMDHRIGVPPPDPAARVEILKQVRVEPAETTPVLNEIPHVDAALELLAELGDRFSRSELKRATVKLVADAKSKSWSSEDDARAAVRRVVDAMADSLTITKDMQASFREHQKRWSDPVLLAAA